MSDTDRPPASYRALRCALWTLTLVAWLVPEWRMLKLWAAPSNPDIIQANLHAQVVSQPVAFDAIVFFFVAFCIDRLIGIASESPTRKH